MNGTASADWGMAARTVFLDTLALYFNRGWGSRAPTP